MIVAELFTQGPRVSAMSISVLINWACNFAVGYVFPIMQVTQVHLIFFSHFVRLEKSMLFNFLVINVYFPARNDWL